MAAGRITVITSSDREHIAADLLEIRNDNPTTVSFRRGSNTLDPQVVRIARRGGSAGVQSSDAAEQVRGELIVIGVPSLDIQPGDRFNDTNGVLCEVVFVRPNRRERTEAEAKIVQ